MKLIDEARKEALNGIPLPKEKILKCRIYRNTR